MDKKQDPREARFVRRMELLDQIMEEMPHKAEQIKSIRQKEINRRYKDEDSEQGEVYQPGEEPLHMKLLDKLRGK